MDGPVQCLLAVLAMTSCVGCATSGPDTLIPVNGESPGHWKAREARIRTDQFHKGVEEAQADAAQGLLICKDIRATWGKDDEILWCYGKLLQDKYGVKFVDLEEGHTEGFHGRLDGYRSVMNSLISARLGSDWEKRIYREAELSHRDHWSALAALYEADMRAHRW